MKYKHVLFWCLAPVTFLVLLVADTMLFISEIIIKALDKFEEWCFNYSEDYAYSGHGIWVSKDAVTKDPIDPYQGYPRVDHHFLKQLTEVFGDDWESWYHSKHVLLDGKTPYQATFTPGGIDKVKEMVNAIQYGGVV